MNKKLYSRHPVLKEYNLLASRKYRKQKGKFILEGYHLLNEALTAGIELEIVLYTAEFKNSSVNRELLARAGKADLTEVPQKIFQAVAQTENPQGVGAIVALPREPVNHFSGKSNFYLLLDEIQDPGNLGTIIRSAAAAAVDGVFLLPGTVDLYNPKVLRATMGGIFYLPVLQINETDKCIETLRQKQIQLVAADPRGGVPYYEVDFTIPSAVVIGNENKGIQKSLLEKADLRAYIPLKGSISSLNAAAAASVFIFEHERQTDAIKR
ncbi:MAG: RNA methyltransferase [Bacillota bacterium]|nr:RNA methyltransferase [Bacillota bacterium]